jgi:hypothetical protein
MNRRVLARVLVVALLAMLAGCSATGSLSMEPIESDEQLVDIATTTPANAGHGTETVEKTIEQAIANETATINGTEPPIGDGVVISSDSGYYALSQTITETQTKHEVVVVIDVNATTVSGETITFDALSSQDRKTVAGLLERTETENHELEDGYDIGIVERYGKSDIDESVFVTSQEYDAVVHDGETYPIMVKRTTEITVHSYEYTATEIAATTEAYADILRETALFSLNSLPENQIDILDEAANGSYYADDTDDDAFDALVDRFLEQTAVKRTEYDAAWLVEYDGQRYIAELEYDRFVEGDPEVDTVSLVAS